MALLSDSVLTKLLTYYDVHVHIIPAITNLKSTHSSLDDPQQLSLVGEPSEPT